MPPLFFMVVFSYLVTRIYPAGFLKNHLVPKIAAIRLKRGQKGKANFLLPISPKITLRKEKKRKNRARWEILIEKISGRLHS